MYKFNTQIDAQVGKNSYFLNKEQNIGIDVICSCMHERALQASADNMQRSNPIFFPVI